MIQDQDQLLTPTETAKELGININTLRHRVYHGQLPAEKIGAQWFVRRRNLPAIRRALEKMRQRVRNQPTIKEVILEFLVKKREDATVDEIYNHVAESVTLLSKTPRNSVFSVLTRMPEVKRVGSKRSGRYKLAAK